MTIIGTPYGEYNVSKSIRWQGKITNRVATVCRMFDLTTNGLRERGVTVHCQLKIKAGDVVYIGGPSGAGKSVLLKELEKAIPPAERVNLNEIKLPDNKTVIDCIDPNLDIIDALKLLSTAGLNDVFCVLNQPATLSDGQKYRFRLAMALAAEKKFVFADEFCSELDRITAAVISYNIHKFAKRTGTTFILAASQEDMLADLSPDVMVVTALSGPAEVVYKQSV